MVTFGRKAAERNPAGTAALRWITTGLRSQRRALRHPAGALKKSSAAEMRKRIREEVMNGTFEVQRIGGRGKAMFVRVGAAILAGTLMFGAPAAMATGTNRAANEGVDVSRTFDRAKIETLQWWVAAGHEEWCKDARLVATDELRRVAPVFTGDAADLDAVPMDEEAAADNRAVFAWESPDGRATYRVTVERFEWLLPIAGAKDAIVWVPTHVEVVSHR
ncbi:MAG: hypothetical protein NVS9B14_24120 [Candidatus Acidiferrum sp.]